MIISSASCRLSFGSCDHSPIAERFGGVALNAAINKRIYIFIRKRSHLERLKYRISYSKTELCETRSDIKHPIVREAIRMVNIKDPLEIIYAADVPSRLGLSTSSAMATALLKGLWYYKGTSISNDILAEMVYNLERVKLGEQGGYQDSYATSFGGISYLTGHPGCVRREAIKLSPEKADEFKNHLMLIYTGNQELSYKILKEQLDKLSKGETLNETLKIKRLVQEMYATIVQPDFKPMDLSYAMKEAWELKKKLSSTMTSPQIAEIEDKINKICPSAGYRLIGAGGGRGFILILTPPEYKEFLKDALLPLKSFEFDFDWDGAKVREING